MFTKIDIRQAFHKLPHGSRIRRFHHDTDTFWYLQMESATIRSNRRGPCLVCNVSYKCLRECTFCCFQKKRTAVAPICVFAALVSVAQHASKPGTIEKGRRSKKNRTPALMSSDTQVLSGICYPSPRILSATSWNQKSITGR